MNNLLLELKTIAGEAKQEDASFDSIRVRLKEVLHYFVLDCIYNSEFKDMIFYGGTCLRIVHNLGRMSEDLDFEWSRNDFEKLAAALESYFKKDIQVHTKTQVNTENAICRITLSFAVLRELGLSSFKEETLRIKVEIRFVTADYLVSITPVHTPKTAYGKSFVLKHYDLPTLFAGKLSAILDRPKKGFTAGDPQEGINFKGRDFFDLLWYMEKGIIPNKKMLEANGHAMSIGEVFDIISIFIAQRDMENGLRKDLEPLLKNQRFVANFVETFRDVFTRLKQERYTSRKIERLERVKVSQDFHNDNHSFIFQYNTVDSSMLITFTFMLTWEFLQYSGSGKAGVPLDSVNQDIIFTQGSVHKNANQYVPLLNRKIDEYLKQHNNEVYFEQWKSKLIRTSTGNNFNPEKEIVFTDANELLNKAVTLEELAMTAQ